MGEMTGSGLAAMKRLHSGEQGSNDGKSLMVPGLKYSQYRRGYRCPPGRFGAKCDLGIHTIFPAHNIYGDIPSIRQELGLNNQMSGWSPDKDFYAPLIKALSPRLIVEIGVWKGLSAGHLAMAMKTYVRGGALIAVDTWLGALEFWTLSKSTKGKPDASRDLRLHHGYPHVYYEFLLNMIDAGVQDYVIPFPSTSRMANTFLADAKVFPDLIHIDAAHEYVDAREDIELWWRLLRSGGMLLGDDFSPSWLGVVQAACEHAMHNGIPLYRTGKKWWVFKGPRVHHSRSNITAQAVFNTAELSRCIKSPVTVAPLRFQP